MGRLPESRCLIASKNDQEDSYVVPFIRSLWYSCLEGTGTPESDAVATGTCGTGVASRHAGGGGSLCTALVFSSATTEEASRSGAQLQSEPR